VLEIVNALDGDLSPAVCTQGECEHLEGCGAASVWLEAKNAIEDVLRRATIAGLLERERSTQQRSMMYHI
jgi:DNA-binding IscR family transcriptional regulator